MNLLYGRVGHYYYYMRVQHRYVYNNIIMMRYLTHTWNTHRTSTHVPIYYVRVTAQIRIFYYIIYHVITRENPLIIN